MTVAAPTSNSALADLIKLAALPPLMLDGVRPTTGGATQFPARANDQAGAATQDAGNPAPQPKDATSALARPIDKMASGPPTPASDSTPSVGRASDKIGSAPVSAASDATPSLGKAGDKFASPPQAALAAKLPLPSGASPSQPRAPDQVALAPPPNARALSTMVLTGQQRLATVLPALELLVQAEGAEPAPLQLGHVARALGDAAHWIDAGASGLIASNEADRPSPEVFEAWRQPTRAALHDASGLLAQAEQQLEPGVQQPSLQPSAPTAAQLATQPDVLWAMSQIVAAQRQIGVALATLSSAFLPLPAPSVARRRPTVDLRSAIALLGIALFLCLLALAYGTWLLSGTIVAVAGTLFWLWRTVIPLRLEVWR